VAAERLASIIVAVRIIYVRETNPGTCSGSGTFIFMLIKMAREKVIVDQRLP
jgi:hypothetical protein